jgi:hypothetical protein
MKRPRIVWFVAVWCFLALLPQVTIPYTSWMRAHGAHGQTPPVLVFALFILAFTFVAWQAAGLSQMRRFNRWFAVVFFVWWSISLLWKSMTVLRVPTGKVITASLFISLLVALNLLSAWYLSRRSFREFAVQFVAERDKERNSRMMQEDAQTKLLDEIRRNKK